MKSPTPWQSEIVARFLNRAGKTDAIAAVRENARKLTEELAGPPFDVECERIRHQVGIKRVRRPRSMSLDGRIFWERDGYVLEVSSRLPEARARFTFAHEVAHTFFMNGDSGATKNRTDAETGRFSRRNEEEYLCDVAAAEILMPHAQFVSRASAYGPSVPAILALANDFKVSLSAAARRFAETSLWRCHLGFWTVGSDDRAVFEFGVRPAFMRLSIAKGRVANPAGIVARAIQVTKPITSTSDIGLMSEEGEPLGEAFVQAMYLPRLRRVVTMVILERHAAYLCRMIEGTKGAEVAERFQQELPLRRSRFPSG